MTKITVKVRIAWWVKPYLRTVLFLCWVFNAEPDMEKVGYWVKKGLYLES